jgi:hypothetical protein
MNITNRFGLPETIVNALKKPQYSKGGSHMSATELLSPPRMVQLRIKHANQIEMDASDMVFALFGTAIHGVLEHGQGEDHIVEQRLHTEIDGWSVSGAIDLQTVEENAIAVSDYKTCGVYAVMNEKKEWEQQLNIYAWLVERVKKSPVSKLEIVAIIRDWKRRDSETKRDYPRAPIQIIPIELWPYQEREDFVQARIHLHAEAMFQAQTGGDLPLCTESECWEKPTVYAVKKLGGVRANRVFYKRAEAEAYLAEVGDKYEVEVREGERTRCENYCNVAQFCSQYQDYLKGK